MNIASPSIPQIQFSCPGKIFILGEYSCLTGEQALVGTTAPYFSLRAQDEETTVEIKLPFAEKSPAEIYLSKQADTIKGFKLEWHDPYDTPIGVGSSSAQFILSVRLVSHLREEAPPSTEQLLKLYWEMVGSTQGIRPSGVDVVAQWLGGTVLVQTTPEFSATKIESWDQERETGSVFMLAYTGQKTRTHEHLLSLQSKGFPGGAFNELLLELKGLTEIGVNSWKNTDARRLGAAMNAYQDALTEAGLLSGEMADLLEEAQEWPGVLGVKGSGAQGGDCVLFLVQEKQMPLLLEEIRGYAWVPHPVTWSNQGIVKR